MSLSVCGYCGGHIPLGPDASNRCDKCGRNLYYQERRPPVSGIDDSEIVAPQAENAALKKELAMVRGAMRAQDEREAIAGARCGVGAELHGYDWPDAVADQVLMLKANNELLEKRGDYCTKIESELAMLRKENEALKKRERDRWENADSAFGKSPNRAEFMNLPMNPNDMGVDWSSIGTRRPGDF